MKPASFQPSMSAPKFSSELCSFFPKVYWGTLATSLSDLCFIISSETNIAPHYFFRKKCSFFSEEIMRVSLFFFWRNNEALQLLSINECLIISSETNQALPRTNKEDARFVWRDNLARQLLCSVILVSSSPPLDNTCLTHSSDTTLIFPGEMTRHAGGLPQKTCSRNKTRLASEGTLTSATCR